MTDITVNGTGYLGGYTRVQPKRFEDLSPEKQARVLSYRAEQAAKISAYLQKSAAIERQAAADARGHEVWNRRAPNVSTLTREQALDQIEFMSELIQSGEADKLPLVAARGTQTTSNYRQYVYWAQQRLKELDSTGESVPQQASTGTAGTPGIAGPGIGWRRITESVKYEDLSPEQKARWALDDARVAEADRIAAEMAERSKLQAVESNDYCAPYVQGLSREQALTQIYFASEVIRNGQEEKYTLSTSLDGKQTTSNFRQYVYWLQQHVKELEATPQSTLAQV